MSNASIAGDDLAASYANADAASDWRMNGAFSAKAKAGYAPGLDGVRAIAVLIVLVAHFGLAHIIPGGFGVTIFFFISGFLITRLLIAEREESGGVQFGKFYARRALRLLPALFAFLAITTLMFLPFGVSPTPLEAFSAAFYLHNYFSLATAHAGVVSHMPWGHLWSLAVEEHFYIFYPLLFAALPKRSHMLAALSFIIIGCLAWRLFAIFGLHFPLDYPYKASDARLDSIGWGCLLAVMLDGAAKDSWLKKLIGLGPTLFAGALLAASFLLRSDEFRETIRYSMQGAAMFVGILNLFVWRPLSYGTAFLEVAPLRFIGRLSYSLYLWHMPIADYLGHTFKGAGPIHMVLGFAASFVAACLSYYLIERPFLGLRRKFGSHARA